MPEQDTAIQLNLARSRQEVKRQNNKLHSVTFQNKTLRVDTSTHREASCLPYCAVVDSNCNRWGLPEGGAKPDWSRNAANPYPVEIGPTHEPFSWLKTKHKEANVSVGLTRATNVAKLANLKYFMKITNPPETKQILTCPTEREQPLHHFSSPSHAPVVSTAQTLHRCWLSPTSFFIQPFSTQLFLPQAFFSLPF